MRKSILGAGAGLLATIGSALGQGPGMPAYSSEPPITIPAGPVTYGDAVPYDGGFGSTDVLTTGNRPTGYIEGSFLLSFIDNGPLTMPLATGGPSLGIVGRPGTTTLLGGSELDYGTLPGFKIGAGRFLAGSQAGLMAEGFYLGKETVTGQVNGGSVSTISRPFFDVVSGTESARVISSPGAFQGAVTFDSSTQAYGFEVNPFIRLAEGALTMDVFAGFRYLQHIEDLNIYDRSLILGGGVSAFNGFGLGAGSTVLTTDQFSATNTFYGGQVGTRIVYTRTGGFFVDVTGKIAVGGVSERVSVIGNTSVFGSPFAAPATTGGGTYTSSGQVGRRTQSSFAAIPELNALIGYQVTQRFNVFAGYNFLYLSDAARPGDQISRSLNVRGIPTVAAYDPTRTAPTRGVVSNDLYIHGFSFGLTLGY